MRAALLAGVAALALGQAQAAVLETAAGKPLLTGAGKPVLSGAAASSGGTGGTGGATASTCGTIAAVDMPAGMIAQRAYGTHAGPVWQRATYTGTSCTLQAAVLNFRTGATVQDFADLPAGSGGAVAGPISVPQGGPYKMALREKGQTAVTTATNPYSVGMNIVISGQSDTPQMFGGGGFDGGILFDTVSGYAVEPYQAAINWPDGWHPLDGYVAGSSAPNPATLWSGGTSPPGPLNQMAGLERWQKLLQAADGQTLPVGFVVRYAPGQDATSLYNPAGTYYPNFWPSLKTTAYQNQPAGTYAAAEQWFIDQGGSNADGDTAKATLWTTEHKRFFEADVTPWQASAGWSAAQTFYGMEIIKRANPANQPFDDQVRQEQLQFVVDETAAARRVASFVSSVDRPIGSSVDFATWTKLQGIQEIGRVIQTSLWAAGKASFGGGGARITGGTRVNGTTFTLAVTHSGGTALLNADGTGAGGAVTGFTASNAADLSNPLALASSTIADASHVTVTLAAASSATVCLGYQRTVSPDVTEPLYDNAILSAANPSPFSPGDNSTISTLGAPVQPTLGAVCVP